MNKSYLIILIAIISTFYAGCGKDDEIEEIEESNEIPIANFSGNPLRGPAPLTVKFTDHSENKPTSWLWTLGDNSTSTIKNPIRTYNNEGSYSVTLSVTNRVGSDTKINTNYIVVTASNTSPAALFTVSPSSGTVNTNFAFNASGSTDDYDPISNLQVRWDFDGNGSWDTDWDTDKTQNHQYSNDGTHTAKLEVKDTEGLTDQYTKNITVNDNAHPTALFTASPSDGLINTIFEFDASGSTDDDLISNLQVRWDFDGNGSWDTDWDTDKTQNYQYSNGSTYTAILEVKDTEGLTDQYTKSIIVHNGCGGEANLTYGGQTYEIVEIGYQCWMAKNLNYETTDSRWYNNSSANGDVYGRLYTWEAALTACPSGWSLPSDEEWKIMEMVLGMSQIETDYEGWRGTDEGEKMKSTSGWYSDGNGTNSSDFNALPGGYRSSSGSFNSLGIRGYWWSSTENSGSDAWYRHLSHSSGEVYRLSRNEAYGYSVRCIKD